MIPKISVIVLTYNSSDTLREALDSVLRQKCGYDFEIVAGDDGSTDGTQSILQEYATRHPEHIRLLLSEHNRGVQANYFDCLEACRGEFIADCAADDYWPGTERLQKLAEMLDHHPEASMVFSDWTYMNPDGRTEYARPVAPHDCGRGALTPHLLSHTGSPAVHLSSAIYRKNSLMNDYGLHRDDIYRCPDFGCEDLQVLVALSEAAPAVYLPESTLIYRVGGNSITSARHAARAARFAFGTLRLRLLLAMRHALDSDPSFHRCAAVIYHFALANAMAGNDRTLIKEIAGLWPQLRVRPIKTRIVNALAHAPALATAIYRIKTRES